MQKPALAIIDANVALEHAGFKKHHVTDPQLALADSAPGLGLVFGRTWYLNAKLLPVGQVNQAGAIDPAFGQATYSVGHTAPEFIFLAEYGFDFAGIVQINMLTGNPGIRASG